MRLIGGTLQTVASHEVASERVCDHLGISLGSRLKEIQRDGVGRYGEGGVLPDPRREGVGVGSLDVDCLPTDPLIDILLSASLMTAGEKQNETAQQEE